MAIAIRKPSHPEPPTVTNLEVHGAAGCLAALREEFTWHHSPWRQYRGWADSTALGVVRSRIGGGHTFVRAEPGDLVLVRREHGTRVAYVPRVGWNVCIDSCNVEEVPHD